MVTAGRRPTRALRGLLLGTLLVALLLVGAGAAVSLHLAGNLERVDGAFPARDTRPAASPGTSFLMVGTTTRRPTASLPWLSDRPGLESLMLVHVSADGRHATVDSFALTPRLVADVTAAEPSRMTEAVERRTGQRVDHLLAVDWATLQRLADDNDTGMTYVPGSPVPRQQEFLRATLEASLHAELRRQPWNLYAALDTVSRGTAVEAEWSVLDIQRLVFSLRNLRSADIEFRSEPVGRN